MNDEQLLRYSRHILLDEVGIEGQERVLASHALVIGAGGLGSPVALYLGSAGVGRITLVDHDVVDLTNLQRQVAHTTDRVGQPKVESAAQAVRAINPMSGCPRRRWFWIAATTTLRATPSMLPVFATANLWWPVPSSALMGR